MGWFTSLLLLLWFFDFENLLIMCFDVGLWIHLPWSLRFLVGKWSNTISSMFLPVCPLSLLPASLLPSISGFPQCTYWSAWWYPRDPLGFACWQESVFTFCPSHLITSKFLFSFFSHAVACGILVSQPGIKSRSWQWKHWVLTSGQLGNSPNYYFQIHWFFLLPAQICLWNPPVSFSFQ